MSKDSDLYGDDIRLWSETQSALLRRLSTGESVADQVDWPHVVEEIGHSHAQRPKQQDEIARLTARLTAAEALVKELRSRLDDLSSQLGATKAELATAQDEAETATARAVTAARLSRHSGKPMLIGVRVGAGRASEQRGGENDLGDRLSRRVSDGQHFFYRRLQRIGTYGGGVQHPQNTFHYLRHSDRGGQERAHAFRVLCEVRRANEQNADTRPFLFSHQAESDAIGLAGHEIQTGDKELKPFRPLQELQCRHWIGQG
jgi:hypothetical protein